MKKVKEKLSDREKQIWVYLLGYFSDNGYSPTRQEIADVLKFSNLPQIHKCLYNMQKKGWIKLSEHKWRNIIDPQKYEK